MPVTILNTGIFNPSTGDTAHAGVAAADATAFVCTTTQTIVAGVASASAVSLQPGGNYSTGTARATAAAVPAIIGTLAAAGVASASTNGQQPVINIGVTDNGTAGPPTAVATAQNAAGAGNPVIRGVPWYYNSGVSGVGSTFTVTKDPGVQSGDMILVFMTWNGTAVTPSITGFTSYTKTTNSLGIALFSRQADGTEGTTFTVTFSSGYNVAAVCVAYQNTNDVFDPIPSNSGTISLSATIIPGVSITTTKNNDVLVWFGAVRANGSGAPVPVISPPSALAVEGGQTATSATGSANMSVLMADGAGATAGATGAMTGTSSLSDNVGGILLALQASTTTAIVNVSAGHASAIVTAAINAVGSGRSANAGLAAATAAAEASTVTTSVGSTVVGSYISEGYYAGSLTHAQAISAWQTNTGRFMGAERIYYSTLPASIPANVSASITAGRTVVLSFKPFMTGTNPLTGNAYASPIFSSTSQTTLDASFTTTLAGLAAGGANGSNCIIPLWAEPWATQRISVIDDFIEMFRHYAAIVQTNASGASPRFQLSFCTSAGSVVSGVEGPYYPGDSYVDVVGTDYYATAYDSGDRMGGGGVDDPAYYADNATPPKPFGVFECMSSTDTSAGGQTVTQADNFWAYLLSYFQGRLSGGQPCAPICCFNSASNLAQETPIIVADGVAGYNGVTEYRNALITTLIDGVT